MTTFKDWLRQGVILAVLLPFRADFSIVELSSTEIARLKAAIAAARLARKAVPALAAE
jgi:hypothetical protein